MSPTITTGQPLKSIAELTTDWLSQALNTSITSFTPQRIGTGQVSAVYRLTLEYASPVETASDTSSQQPPKTVIFKAPSEDEGSRQAGVLLGLYERETRFYTDVAPQINGGAVSECYHASFDAKSGAFSLLISDAAPSTVGNEIVGATLEQARLAARELGVLHGQALVNEAFEKSEWLNRPPPVNQDMMSSFLQEFQQVYKDRVKANHVFVAHQMVTVFDEMTAQWRLPDVVNGLIHGDYRLDNMLFGESGTAAKPLTVVDWQTVTRGPFMSDFAYFLGSSIPTEMRRQHADELLQIYYEALGPNPPVTLDQCKAGLRNQCFFGVTMSIISPIMVERTDRGDDMFMAMFERACEQVLDLNAIESLPQAGGAREPLKPIVEDEGLHTPKDETHWQESYYFDFIDANQDLGGYIRMGLDPKNNRTWYTLLLAGENRPTVSIVDFAAPVPDAKLRFQTDAFQASHSCQSPLESFHVLVDGKARTYTDPAELLQVGFEDKGTEQNVKFYLVWKTSGTPYQYRLTTRYEIPCLVSGTISIGDETFFLQNALGQRDHSWGSRDWWSMDWVWSAIHLNDSTRIHGLDLRVPSAPRMGMGYIQEPAQAATAVSTEKADIVVSVASQPNEVVVSAVNSDQPSIEAASVDSNAIQGSTQFSPLPLTDETTSPGSALPVPLSSPKILSELSTVQSTESFKDNGLIEKCTHVIEPASLTVEFEARGHAPLRLTADDGRVAMFPRAWGRVVASDGREGWAWMEWNRNGVKA